MRDLKGKIGARTLSRPLLGRTGSGHCAPPVELLKDEAGMVLGNINDSGVAPVVRLTEVFRQAAHSRIIITAHRINKGMMPETLAREADSDFCFIDRAEPEQIAATVLDVVKQRVPAKFGLDPSRRCGAAPVRSVGL